MRPAGRRIHSGHHASTTNINDAGAARALRAAMPLCISESHRCDPLSDHHHHRHRRHRNMSVLFACFFNPCLCAPGKARRLRRRRCAVVKCRVSWQFRINAAQLAGKTLAQSEQCESLRLLMCVSVYAYFERDLLIKYSMHKHHLRSVCSDSGCPQCCCDAVATMETPKQASHTAL